MNLTVRSFIGSAVVMLTFAAPSCSAAVSVFGQDLAGFNAAAGSPPVAISFDSFAADADIGGATIAGVRFVQTGAPLLVSPQTITHTPHPGMFSAVIDANSNRLTATSGDNVLSPGGGKLGAGPMTLVEKDGMRLEFSTPVPAFGFDHLSQSADGGSDTTISVYGTGNNLLYSDLIPISNVGGVGPGAPGGVDFWGIVSDKPIEWIEISETKTGNVTPDTNIGYDSFRFFAVPEVEEYAAVVALGLLGFACWRRRWSSRVQAWPDA